MRPFRGAVAALALVVWATGCHESPTAGLADDAVLRLANPVAWPGGEIVVSAGAFVGLDSLPVVLLDTTPLAVRRLDDSTVSAHLPDTSGVFALHVKLLGGDRFGGVRIVGFTMRAGAPALTGWPQPLAPGSPVVYAAAESTLVRLDLGTGVAAPIGIGHSGSCTVSPGPSYRAQGVVANAAATPLGCARAVAWTLGATAAPADSAPGPLSGTANLWAELSPGTWLLASHHQISVYQAGVAGLSERIESTERVVFSPDRSLAVPLATYTALRVPVLASATGAALFRLPLEQAEGVAFSPGGDTLFAAGVGHFVTGSPTSEKHLVAVSAPSGAVAMDSVIPLPQLWDLVLDPGGPWLYGLAYTDDGTVWQPVVHVFDRRTLRHVAAMRPPAATTCVAVFCGQLTLAIDAGARQLYALEIASWGTPASSAAPSAIYTFDLVPATQAAQVLTP